jgi:hypothetical protein
MSASEWIIAAVSIPSGLPRQRHGNQGEIRRRTPEDLYHGIRRSRPLRIHFVTENSRDVVQIHRNRHVRLYYERITVSGLARVIVQGSVLDGKIVHGGGIVRTARFTLSQCY